MLAEKMLSSNLLQPSLETFTGESNRYTSSLFTLLPFFFFLPDDSFFLSTLEGLYREKITNQGICNIQYPNQILIWENRYKKGTFSLA